MHEAIVYRYWMQPMNIAMHCLHYDLLVTIIVVFVYVGMISIWLHTCRVSYNIWIITSKNVILQYFISYIYSSQLPNLAIAR